MPHPDPLEEVPALIAQLYQLVARLEELFDHERKFTPDGHLVGSIGEVIAQRRYKLRLEKPSTKGYDAKTADGTQVQIKVTQGGSVGLREEPQHLLVLSLNKQGQDAEVYNGPGKLAWDAAGKMQSNGQKPITLSKLRKLMDKVLEQERVPRQ